MGFSLHARVCVSVCTRARVRMCGVGLGGRGGGSHFILFFGLFLIIIFLHKIDEKGQTTLARMLCADLAKMTSNVDTHAKRNN